MIRSKHKTEKWASGKVHRRTYGPNENIAGGTLLIKIDTRFGMPQIGIYTQMLQPERFPESKLYDLRLFLEVEGITTHYYAERIVDQIIKDIEKLQK